MKRFIVFLLSFAFLLTPGFFKTNPSLVPPSLAQTEQPKDVRYYSQQAIKAYEAKNYTAYLENMKMALQLRPNNSRLMYNLASAQALVGNKAEALTLLARVAEMGMIYAASKDSDFDSVKETAEFKAILKRFEDNKAPINHSSSAFTLKEKVS